MPATKNESAAGRGKRKPNSSPPPRRHFLFSLPIFPARLTFWLPAMLAVFLAGCAPSGPRALVQGKKYLDRGDYAAAVDALHTATTLLATNAVAWNDYGVALQHAGRLADAVLAYQNAIKFDRDLTEAHYNLGCLWLALNKPDAARAEFTAYTLRRNNSPDGWLQLGRAQLRAGDVLAAEKSFSTVLYLRPNDPEALNGLGLARVQRGRPREAAQFFAAAVRARPDFAPAILNLAVVCDRYLHDEPAALQNYRAYLALTPRPANWDAVNALVQDLQPAPAFAAVNPSRTAESRPAEGQTAVSQPPTRNLPPAETPPAETRVAPSRTTARNNLPPRAAETTPVLSPREIVRVSPPPTVVAAENAVTPSRPAGAPRSTGSPAPSRLMENYAQTGVTPLTASAAPPIKVVPPAPPVFPRYAYLSPPKPAPGNRAAAMRAFVEAQQFARNLDWALAADAYHRAAELDPSWFEAQYNYGVMAARAGQPDQSLAAYEMALAIRPDSTDARYNFALELTAAGYVTDAENELKKIVAEHPNDVRAQLALANLYAQQLRDPERARTYYLKVLELDPHNPQATNIRFWLSAHPP
jgi:tetratricopeptide (TPR) repeat protein